MGITAVCEYLIPQSVPPSLIEESGSWFSVRIERTAVGCSVFGVNRDASDLQHVLAWTAWMFDRVYAKRITIEEA